MIEHSSSSYSSANQPYAIDRYNEKNGAPKRAVVVLLHGVDGLGTLSGVEIQKFAEQIAGAGFLVMVPHYFDASDGADTQPVAELFERRLPRLAGYPPRIAAAVEYALKSSRPLLDALDKSVVIHDHCFYDDANPGSRDHPFLPGGKADLDSRSRSVAWLKTHLMPAS